MTLEVGELDIIEVVSVGGGTEPVPSSELNVRVCNTVVIRVTESLEETSERTVPVPFTGNEEVVIDIVMVVLHVASKQVPKPRETHVS